MGNATAEGAGTAAGAPGTGRACWAGLDGCRSGWVLAVVHDAGTGRAPTVSAWRSFAAAIEAARRHGAGVIGVDMPIGLSDDGRRVADTEARALLGARRSTVFPTPVRDVLDAVDYRDALERSRRASGKGLSKQAWNLVPKITEVDRLVSPVDEDLIFEVHPELAFARLAGAVLAEPKKTPAGRARRLALLATAAGLDGDDGEALVRARPAPGVAPDDVLDALAVACSARALGTGRGTVLGDGTRDRRGLVMRICY